MNYFVIFKKFLGFDDEGRAWGQIYDSEEKALRPVIFLYPNGFFSIPKKEELVSVSKHIDSDYLYLQCSPNNSNIINIDNENKLIEINNINGFTINVNGSVNINANEINLGGTGGGLALTTNDIGATGLLDSQGLPCTLATPTTTITRIK